MTHIYKYIPLFLAALFFAACNKDEVKYEPAEPIAADNWGVYFDGKNASEYPRAVSDPNKLDFVLRRANTTGEVTVPIDAEITLGSMTASGSVTFAAGESTATYSITYTGLDKGKIEFTLSIPEMYINPYAEKEGFYKQKVVIYEPTVVSKRVVMAAADEYSTTFDNDVYTITQVPCENRFFWNNFLNSGINLSFKIDGTFDPDNVRNCKGNLVPLNHYYTEEGDDYGWYLATEEDPNTAETAHSWTHNGDEISGMYFYWGSYVYLDFGGSKKNGSGYFSPLTQGNEWYYYNFYIYYDED